MKFINYYQKIKSSPERLDLENNPPAKPHEEEEEKRVMCKRLWLSVSAHCCVLGLGWIFISIWETEIECKYRER